MTTLIIILCLILIGIVIVQLGRVNELAGKIRGQEASENSANNFHGIMCIVFLIGFMIMAVWTTAYYKNWCLGYGPHTSASEHGELLDGVFNITVFFTAIVFVATQIALFVFGYIYRYKKGRKTLWLPHDNKLEIIWTAIPAFVMTILVVGGLDAWNTVMADVGPDEEYMEIEATGSQFLWFIRYPGADGKLGTKDYKKITGINPLGQDFTDAKNWDDFQPSEIVLPVNKKVRVRITARDVLHNFDLPHFRVKMDAIPGLPTYFVFKPTITTEQYRQNLKEYPEYNVLADPEDPENKKKLWEEFDYELACAELCGKGHFSMRKTVRIVTQEEYDLWLAEQQSFYMSQIRNSDEDPMKGKALDMEIRQRRMTFNNAVEKARASETDKVIRLDHVKFQTGSANLTDDSRYELDNLIGALNKYPEMVIEVMGHTDNVGNPTGNQTLSNSRAASVVNYLLNKGVNSSRMTSKGYGDKVPVEDNATAEGRAKNRRTEFKIISQ